jgi:hypothetical protein
LEHAVDSRLIDKREIGDVECFLVEKLHFRFLIRVVADKLRAARF